MKLPQQNILIIEDEAQIRKFLRISLESQALNVDEASNATQGLSMAEAHAYDLIVLDLGLPDIDGQTVISQLRQHLKIPIIVLSVRASEDEKIEALDNGANDYVTKPFAIGELMARVRALLRLNQTIDTTQNSIELQDLVINPATREVLRGKEQLHLSRKEFDLLHLLAIKPGRILTHQVLLSTLWGDSFVNETHYLRVLVGHLRQKLGDDPMQPDYIVTVQGVGYRIK